MFFVVLVLAAAGSVFLIFAGHAAGSGGGALPAFFIAFVSLGTAALLASLDQPVGTNWFGFVIGFLLGGAALGAF